MSEWNKLSDILGPADIDPIRVVHKPLEIPDGPGPECREIEEISIETDDPYAIHRMHAAACAKQPVTIADLASLGCRFPGNPDDRYRVLNFSRAGDGWRFAFARVHSLIDTTASIAAACDRLRVKSAQQFADLNLQRPEPPPAIADEAYRRFGEETFNRLHRRAMQISLRTVKSYEQAMTELVAEKMIAQPQEDEGLPVMRPPADAATRSVSNITLLGVSAALQNLADAIGDLDPDRTKDDARVGDAVCMMRRAEANRRPNEL